jgi:hypothetical protein
LLHRLMVYLPWVRFVTNDIDDARKATFHLDATKWVSWQAFQSEGPFDWVIENPPFGQAIGILRHATSVARSGVACMARVSFTEPTRERGEWLAAHPYQKRVTMERYSFTGNGKTDSATTDWLVWAKGPIAGPFGVVATGYRP